MYTPQDRLYTTPEVVPTAQKVLQQIRLERILRRIGFVSNYQAAKHGLSQPPVKLPAIPTVHTIKPFKERSRRPAEVLPYIIQEQQDTLGEKPPHILGKVANKHDFLEKCKRCLAKKTEQQRSKFSVKNIPKKELFEPFNSTKAPVKLPIIPKHKTLPLRPDISDSIKDDELRKHIEQYRKNKSRDVQITESVKKTKRQKRANVERYFQEWQHVFDSSISLREEDEQLADYTILQNLERFHSIPHVNEHRNNEQLYRDKISSNIKQSIRNKKSLDGFNSKPKTEMVPVCDMVFEKQSKFGDAVYVHRNTYFNPKR